jgi:uncharacterized protein YtpQ (UPF0354 family)
MFWFKKNKFIDQAIAYLKPSLPDDGTPTFDLPKEALPVVRPYTENLHICYVVDQGNSFEYVQNSHLEKSGYDQEKLHQIGLENLRKWSVSHKTRVEPYGKIFAVLSGGNFEASLILLDELWNDSFRQFVGGEYSVALPARDILSFCDSGIAGGVDELQQLIARVTPTCDHPISDKIHVRRDGKFEPRTL